MKSGDCRGGYKDLHDDLSYFFFSPYVCFFLSALELFDIKVQVSHCVRGLLLNIAAFSAKYRVYRFCIC